MWKRARVHYLWGCSHHSSLDVRSRSPFPVIPYPTQLPELAAAKLTELASVGGTSPGVPASSIVVTPSTTHKHCAAHPRRNRQLCTQGISAASEGAHHGSISVDAEANIDQLLFSTPTAPPNRTFSNKKILCPPTRPRATAIPAALGRWETPAHTSDTRTEGGRGGGAPNRL